MRDLGERGERGEVGDVARGDVVPCCLLGDETLLGWEMKLTLPGWAEVEAVGLFVVAVLVVALVAVLSFLCWLCCC